MTRKYLQISAIIVALAWSAILFGCANMRIEVLSGNQLFTTRSANAGDLGHNELLVEGGGETALKTP